MLLFSLFFLFLFPCLSFARARDTGSKPPLPLSLCLSLSLSLVHTFTHALTHSLPPSLTHSVTRCLTHLSSCSLIHSLTHSLDRDSLFFSTDKGKCRRTPPPPAHERLGSLSLSLCLSLVLACYWLRRKRPLAPPPPLRPSARSHVPGIRRRASLLPLLRRRFSAR